MRSLKSGCRFCHAVHVQFLWVEAGKSLEKRIADRGVQNAVNVLLLHTGADGVERRIPLDGFKNRNVPWQQSVDRKGNTIGWNRAGGTKIGTVMPGMYAGIGPAAADRLHRVPAYRTQGLLQCFLHGTVIALHLPAMIAGTVITKVQQNVFSLSAHHSPNAFITLTAARSRIPRNRAT